MRSFMDAKSMARDLRETLAARGHVLPHSACLELVAKQFGLADWNTLAARIERSGARRHPLPAAKGWRPTNLTDPARFRLGLDPERPGVALIESRIDRSEAAEAEAHFGCLMQSVSAEAYRGRTLRLSAELKADGAGLGTIWMRIDGASETGLRFDNMMERPQAGAISGTTAWLDRSVVLDVPGDAASLHYGFFLRGLGQIRARGFRLEVVDPSMTVTGGALARPERILPSTPVNLDFRRSEAGHA
ncbi:MAG: hypothetical protein ABS35_27370 [Kaistia sp. SCN 65-12]|nr:MAG: hypothetical protein ABS35_27370 [Kaistia sp. SCN 65-12]